MSGATPWAEERSNREQKALRKKEAVLAAAAKLFKENGLESTTLSDIAEALGVTKPTIYYYVENKDQMILEVINSAFDELLACFHRASLMRGTGIEKLRAAVRECADVILSDKGRCLMLPPGKAPSPALIAENEVRRKRAEEYMFEVFETGFRDGTLRKVDKRVAMNTIFGSLSHLHRWIDYSGMTLEEILDQQMDLFTRGCGGPSAEAAGAPFSKKSRSGPPPRPVSAPASEAKPGRSRRSSPDGGQETPRRPRRRTSES